MAEDCICLGKYQISQKPKNDFFTCCLSGISVSPDYCIENCEVDKETSKFKLNPKNEKAMES